MARNQLAGKNQLNDEIWQAREITEEGGHKIWLSTGRQDLLVVHANAKDTIAYFLSRYPETDTIQAILDDHFRMALPSERRTLLDAVLDDLGIT